MRSLTTTLRACVPVLFRILSLSAADRNSTRSRPTGGSVCGAIERGQVELGEHGRGAARDGVHLEDTGQDPAVQLLQRERGIDV